MNKVFDGAGEWGVTLGCSGAGEGTVVRVSADRTAAACAAGDAFAGVVMAAGRDGLACSVQLGGAATTAYTGEAPAVGWTKLAADGNGGVQATESGREYLVLHVDETAGAVTFVL